MPPSARPFVLAALVALYACGEAPLPVGPGVPLELAEIRHETLSDVRYAFELTVPEAEDQPLTGRVTITLHRDDPQGRPLVIDFKDPSERVGGVRVDGEPASWRAVDDHIVVPLDGRGAGELSVAIDFVAGDEALNRNPDFLYTLFVPDRAHFSLPVFDQPNLKARFTLALDVPGEWEAISNGRIEHREQTPAATGAPVRARYEFAETKPLPTYLFAFATGEFREVVEERDGRRMRMLHRETDDAKVARNLDAIFDLHAAALGWLEDYTGIPYPFDEVGFALIPPFQYGGMEHPGSVFYRQSSLMLDESATQSQLLGRASLIAHETAHMWFGDLVTMDWFDDVWMKEVFANFMAAKIVEPSFPDVNHALRFFLAHHETAYGVDRTAGANPIRQPLENLNQAGTLYGAIIYQKAPIVMRQLELMLGEEPFREGLRAYLRAHAFGNATWQDLVEILDAKSERDVRAWSRVWVEEAGRPDVITQIHHRPDRSVERLVFFQEDPRDEDRLWPQELTAAFVYGDSIVRERVSLPAEAVALEDWKGRPRPPLILPNGGGVEYGHFHLDSLSLRWAVEHAPDVRDDLTRGIVWETLWDAALEGEVRPDTWFDLLLRGIEQEPEEQNAQRLLGFMQTTFWRLLGPEARAARAERLETALWRGIETAATPTRRAAYVQAWRGLVTSDAGRERLRALWEGRERIPGLTLSEQDLTQMAAQLVILGVDDEERVLDRQAERITNPDRRRRFDFVRPALSSDPARREAFFASLAEPANREREPWVLTGLTYVNHPLRAEHALRFVRPALDMVEEIQRTGDIFFPKRWLDAVLGGHSSPEAAAVVQDFIDGLPADYPPRLKGKVLQSADMVLRSARLRLP
ncbi:MAG: hypothetical protein D6701_04505 [Gemmatimonadetes bacterium]|nr:MAG: hypothetical protein D6701_04505 [Gemmatimonadota bacterium]